MFGIWCSLTDSTERPLSVAMACTLKPGFIVKSEIVVEEIPEQALTEKWKSIINKITPHIKEKLFEIHMGMISFKSEKSED